MGKAVIAIHGGAGAISRAQMSLQQELRYIEALSAIVETGQKMLEAGESALDVVTEAVRLLEECPLFNAGIGAVFTRDETHELDACVMDGNTLKAGAVADNNTRAAMLQTGEAQFAFPIPYEQATLLEKNKNIELMASPSIMQRYISMNVTQKPFDNPKVREALNYAINRPALVKVAFAGYATPATGVVPPSIAYAQSYKPWPYDPVKARELLKEAGYPNGFSTTLWSSHNHSTAQKVLQFTQQQLAQVGIKAQVTAMDAGQRAAEVEGKGQKESGVRMFYTGWSASTGEADWALSPLFASQNWPPTLFNTAFYSNKQVDDFLAQALKTNDPAEKTRLYKAAQDIIWQESPWIPLVVEKLVSAHSKNLTGFWIMPDTGFSFEDADLQ